MKRVQLKHCLLLALLLPLVFSTQASAVFASPEEDFKVVGVNMSLARMDYAGDALVAVTINSITLRVNNPTQTTWYANGEASLQFGTSESVDSRVHWSSKKQWTSLEPGDELPPGVHEITIQVGTYFHNAPGTASMYLAYSPRHLKYGGICVSGGTLSDDCSKNYAAFFTLNITKVPKTDFSKGNTTLNLNYQNCLSQADADKVFAEHNFFKKDDDEFNFTKKIDSRNVNLSSGYALSIVTKEKVCVCGGLSKPIYNTRGILWYDSGGRSRSADYIDLPSIEDDTEILIWKMLEHGVSGKVFKNIVLKDGAVLKTQGFDVYVDGVKQPEGTDFELQSLGKYYYTLFNTKRITNIGEDLTDQLYYYPVLTMDYLFNTELYKDGDCVGSSTGSDAAKPTQQTSAAKQDSGQLNQASAVNQSSAGQEKLSCGQGLKLVNSTCFATGCASDADCQGGEYCDATMRACAPKTPVCSLDSDCNTTQVCSGKRCVDPNFAIVLYPGDGQYTARELESMKEKILGNFTQGLDLDSCREKIKVIVADACPSVEYGNCSYANAEKMLDCLGKNKPEIAANYMKTQFIGVGKTDPKKDTPGLNCDSSFPGRIFSRTDSSEEYSIVPAHEIGHSFNLMDQYCYNPPGNTKCPSSDCGVNPTDPALDGDDPVLLKSELLWKIYEWAEKDDYCANRTGYSQRVYGNKWDYPQSGRTIMSMTGVKGPRGWDVNERNHLNNQSFLRCG